MAKTTILFALLLCLQPAFSQSPKLESHLQKYFPILPYHKDIKDIADYFLTNPSYAIDTANTRWEADSNYLFLLAKTTEINFTDIKVDTLILWLGKYPIRYIHNERPADTVFKIGVGWKYDIATDARKKVIKDYKALVKEFIPYFKTM